MTSSSSRSSAVYDVALYVRETTNVNDRAYSSRRRGGGGKERIVSSCSVASLPLACARFDSRLPIVSFLAGVECVGERASLCFAEWEAERCSARIDVNGDF